MAVFLEEHKFLPMNTLRSVFSGFAWAMLVLLFSGFLFCAGCGSKTSQQPIDRVRSEVAEILNKKASQIDVAKPLVEQGADELDIVEIVMALEEAFGKEIPDEAVGENVNTVTVQKLAEIVSKQQKDK